MTVKLFNTDLNKQVEYVDRYSNNLIKQTTKETKHIN